MINKFPVRGIILLYLWDLDLFLVGFGFNDRVL